MSGDMYILVDGQPTPCPDTLTWGRWMRDHRNESRIASTEHGQAWVSTVFLGLDHNFYGDGAPILYETMIFKGPHDGFQERYATRAEAIKGHARAVLMIGGTVHMVFGGDS